MTWRREPTRHSLASKGYKTKGEVVQKFHQRIDEIPPKNIYPVDTDYDFDSSPSQRREKGRKNILAFWWSNYYDSWGYYPLDKSLEWWYDFLWEFVMDWEMHHQEILHYDDVNEVKQQLEKTLYKLEDVIENIDNYSKSEKIAVIDDVIHSSHFSDMIFDIPKLREKFEEKYMIEKNTNDLEKE